LEDIELFKEELGKQIRKQRISKELTLEQLSEQANIDDKHLGKIERGIKQPSAHTLFKLFQAIDMSVDDQFFKVLEELSKHFYKE